MLQEIRSVEVADMVSANSADILAELNQKKQKLAIWPAVAMPSVLAVGGVYWNGFAVSGLVTTALILTICCAIAILYDVHSKASGVLYDLDADAEAAFNSLCCSLQAIADSGGAWRIDAEAVVHDRKYEAGATTVVGRSRLGVANRPPPLLKTNVNPICLPLGRICLYFYPDRVLVYDSTNIAAIEYQDLHIKFSETRFIESGAVPSDARIVGHTWRFVNKDGGPDRRFKDNHEIPVCLYEDIGISTDRGLNELVQISRTGVGAAIQHSTASIAAAIAKMRSAQVQAEAKPSLPRPVAIVERQQHGQALPLPAPTHSDLLTSQQALERIFDLLCCVVVSDGRLSRSEKTLLRDVMRRIGATWSDEELTAKTHEFVARVQRSGFHQVLEHSLLSVPALKQLGKAELVKKCVIAIANADGKADERESELCQRICSLIV